MSVRLTVLAALALLACAPPLTVGFNAAPDLQPAVYRDYRWVLPDQFPTGDPRLDNNPFFVQTVTAAVDKEMTALGLARVTQASDLTVHLHATVRDRVDVFAADERAGYDASGYGRGTQVSQYDEGTILLDIVEAKTQKVIWRGWMQTDISGTIGNDKAMAKVVNAGIAKMFSLFPASCIAR